MPVKKIVSINKICINIEIVLDLTKCFSKLEIKKNKEKKKKYVLIYDCK